MTAFMIYLALTMCSQTGWAPLCQATGKQNE